MGGVCARGTKATVREAICFETHESRESRRDENELSGKFKSENSLRPPGNENSNNDYIRKHTMTRDYDNFIDHSGSDMFPLSFSRELKPSTPARTTPTKDNQKTSFIGKAATVGFEKAVEVLDTLGSSMSSLNPRSGFAHGIASRGNRISILAFEVANTISKGASLFHSLSRENVEFVKKDVLESQWVRELVSTDMKELNMIAAADKREEFDVFTKEVIRFGDLCKDPQWHYLGRFFSKLDTEYSGDKISRSDAELTMQDLTTLVQHTSELYHELHALDRFEQDYQRKLDEVHSLQLSQKESLVILQSELKDQRKLVRSLKKKSLWHKTLEEIMEKLVDIVTYLHQTIVEAFGHSGAKSTASNMTARTQRLGAAGLALHYANIVTQIDNIASRPTSLPPNVRDALYLGLPTSVKIGMRSKARAAGYNKELTADEVKAEMEKTLHWLIPLATNTTKAHQGFGWVGEWANNGNEFGKHTGGHSGIIRLQTLYHADKEKTELHILELVTWLQRLMNIVRQRDHVLSTTPAKGPTRKGPNFHPTTESASPPNMEIQAPTMTLSQEDKDLLAMVGSRKRIAPGVSKSQEFFVGSRRGKIWVLSRSTGNSPARKMSRKRSLEKTKNMDSLAGT